MARVTDSEVKEIIETTIDTTPFIQTATLIVDEDIAPQGLSTARLREIELYLAAHFTTLRERQLKREEFGDSENEYLGEVGTDLDASIYGQQAKVLDTSGTLAKLGEPNICFEVF
jgi:hypothetical protein